MKVGLGDFFVGVINIFVIFLPGGILVATLFYGIQEFNCEAAKLVKSKEAGWLLLIVGSFVLGHFVSFAGSIWEDWRYRKTGDKRAKKEVSGEIRTAVRSIVQSIIPSSLLEEKKIRRWAHALLRQSESASFRDVERKDADRRFFRNFLIVMLAPLLVFVIKIIFAYHPVYIIYIALSILFIFVGYFRYKNQDGKFTQLIYESIIAANPGKIKVASFDNEKMVRRFLVNEKKWKKKSCAMAGIEIVQGYLSTVKERGVQIGVEGDTGWITIKGKSTGTTQPEYKYQIPIEDANAIINNLSDGQVIVKTRYKLNAKGFGWEVDEFKGTNKGLVIAEVETKSKKEFKKVKDKKPKWAVEDITEKHEYRNARLAMNPYTSFVSHKNP